MKYIDRIYGEIEIVDRVVIDIINTDAFQRLKGVDQAGYFDVYFPGTKHSRFEHSLGCYSLLHKFGASIEEQLAGLIHDMSHSAFSHTSDYIFESGRGASQNYQDDIFVDFVQKTNIPDILKRHGFSVGYILDEHNFPLQETELPNLCADRIDYSLRGTSVYGLASTLDIDEILKHLHVIDNKWVFDNFAIAKKYAELFKKLNDIYYSNKEAAVMYLRTSRWIKYAIKMNYINYEELFVTDDEVIAKINTHLESDVELQKLWHEMNNPKIVLKKKNSKNVESVTVKSRIIDPLFLNESIIQHISECDATWINIVVEDSLPKSYYFAK